MVNNKVFYSCLFTRKAIGDNDYVYEPVKIVRGTYSDDDHFLDGTNGQIYDSVQKAAPKFSLNPSSKSNYKDKLYYAFCVEEEELLKYATSTKEMLAESADCDVINLLDENFPQDCYLSEIENYLFCSVYDEVTNSNTFQLTSRIEKGKCLNIYDTNASLIELNLVQDYLKETHSNRSRRIRVKAKVKESAPFDPDELEKAINDDVIAQEHVTHALVSMIYKNVRYRQYSELKSNMMIIGQSGCGKTELIRSLSRHTNIPMTVFDISNVTATGYHGPSVINAIRDLISKCDGNIKKAEHGIIVFDETDKKAKNGNIDSTISKEDVQNELLKMVEGAEQKITVSPLMPEKTFSFKTKNVTFIFIGSFQDLIEQKKKEASTKIGFGSSKDSIKVDKIVILPEDLIKFGMKSELMRRIPVISAVNSLGANELYDVLTKSKISNFKLYAKAFAEKENVEIIASDEVLRKIAEKASQEHAGASGIQRIVDNLFETAIRKFRLLKGHPGELVIKEETITNHDDFELYDTSEKVKKLVYPPKR